MSGRRQTVHDKLLKICSAAKVEVDVFKESTTLTALFISKKHKNQCSGILKESKKLANNHYVNCHTQPINSGLIIILSDNNLPPLDINRVTSEAKERFSDFKLQLNNVLLNNLSENINSYEDIYVAACGKDFGHRSIGMDHEKGCMACKAAIHGDDRVRGLNPKRANQDNGSFVKPKKKFSNKLAEALDGIATETDIQPNEALQSLMQAIAAMGIDKELRANGVDWHIPADAHSITFRKNDTPVLQLAATQLNSDKELSQVLLQLRSLAKGEAPQSAQVSSDYVKDLAATVRNAESQAREVAAKFIPQAAMDVNTANKGL